MGKIRVKIDEKSLYYGIRDDYARGQTATVSTPINQSKNPNKWHKDIIQLMDSGLGLTDIPILLRDKCLRKTTSQANAKVDYFFAFNNLYLDGRELNSDKSFGIYVKEETDKLIKNKKGQMVQNTHLGRMKLHYPTTLVYHSKGFNIDNKSVLDKIIKANGGFAFVVRGFEVDTETKSLNFLTSIIGLKGILLSNVFRIQKGTGKKLLININEVNLEAQDIVSDSENLYSTKEQISSLNPDFEELSKSKAKIGELGEHYVMDNIDKLLGGNIEDVYHTSKDYPTAPYDIEYTENGVKKYLEVKATIGDRKIFNMSSGEIRFMTKYKDYYTLLLLTDIKDKFPNVFKYNCEKINTFKKEYPSTRFYAN